MHLQLDILIVMKHVAWRSIRVDYVTAVVLDWQCHGKYFIIMA
jgi:hypothetical protein